jgi:Zn-dependent M28 family amino/carboxypeptidase
VEPLRVDPASIEKLLTTIARPRSPFSNPDAARDTARFIREFFLTSGYRVEEDRFQYGGELYSNLIATRESEPEPLLIGAHFDAVDGSPGADDNATGIAVMLEVARLLSATPAADKIRFAAFNLEESGVVGSRHFVERLRRSGGRLNGMVSLEMLGFTAEKQLYPPGLGLFYPKKGNFIGVAANRGSRNLLKTFVRGMKRSPGLPVETITLPGAGTIIPALRQSDHAPFWDAGIPALLVTDTAFFRNPNYHTPKDTAGTINLVFLTQVAQGVLEGILETVGGVA